MPIYFAGLTSSILFGYRRNNGEQLIIPFSEIIHTQLTDVEIGNTYLLLWQSERLFISYDPDKLFGCQVIAVQLPNPSIDGYCKLVVPHYQRERISILSTNNVFWEYDIIENVWEIINIVRPNSGEHAVRIIHCGYNMLLTNLERLLIMYDQQEVTEDNVKFIDIVGITGIRNDIKQVFLLGNDSNIYVITIGMLQSEDGNMVPDDILGPDMVLILFQPKFMQIAGGAEHCASITEEGHLYTWGSNVYGELGIGDNFGPLNPALAIFQNHDINIMVKVKKVQCGNNFTICLTDDSTLWGTGDNSYGQLNTFATISYSKFMKLNTKSLCGKTVKDLKCNEKGTAIITE